jgi:hypothetical protein
MTLRERIRLLAPVIARFDELPSAGEAELAAWVADELGSVDALDLWQPKKLGRRKAVAPAVLLHVLAGNFAAGGMQSLIAGLILGSQNRVKLPSLRGGEAGHEARARIESFIEALPAGLSERVTTCDVPDFTSADAVIAFGTDATVAEIQRQIRPGQRFIGHGHRLSFIWLGSGLAAGGKFAGLAEACARDFSAYDQTGCLSPQAAFLDGDIADAEAFGLALARAMVEEARAHPPAPLGLAGRALVCDARATAAALGDLVLTPPEDRASLAWTVIVQRAGAFRMSPLARTAFVRAIGLAELGRHVRDAGLRGHVSTVGLAGELTPEESAVFVHDWGATRFCPIGRMQSPPIDWRHDGLARLASLVTWTDAEGLG